MAKGRGRGCSCSVVVASGLVASQKKKKLKPKIMLSGCANSSGSISQTHWLIITTDSSVIDWRRLGTLW